MAGGQNDLNSYYLAIGRVTVLASGIEDLALGIIGRLSPNGSCEHRRLLRVGLAKILDALIKLAIARFNAENADALIKCAKEAKSLAMQRNEIVHGVWVRMVDAHTGDYHHMQRFRGWAEKGDMELSWDVKTPRLDELQSLAVALERCHAQLLESFEMAFARDMYFGFLK